MSVMVTSFLSIKFHEINKCHQSWLLCHLYTARCNYFVLYLCLIWPQHLLYYVWKLNFFSLLLPQLFLRWLSRLRSHKVWREEKKNKLKIPFSSVDCDCTRFKWRKNSFLLKNFQKCYKLVKRIGKRSIYDLKPPFHSGDFEHFQTKIVNCNFNCFFYGEKINVCISSCDQKHIILCKQTAF